MVESLDDLVSGKHYIIASGADGSVKAMGSQNSSHYRNVVEVTATNGIIPETANVCEFVIYGPDADGNYSIYDAQYNSNAGGYLYASSGTDNYLDTQADNDANGKWSISIADGGAATLAAQGTNSRNLMRFNSTRYSCYGSNTTVNALPYLFAKDNEATPIEDVTVTAAGYATYVSSQNALDFTGVSAYKVSAVNASSIHLEEIDEAPAGTPVIIKADAGTYPLATTANPAAVTGNLLKVSDGNAKTDDSYQLYGLAKKGDPAVVGFYPIANTVTLSKGKVYLSVAKTNGVKSFLGFEEDTATGVEVSGSKFQVSSDAPLFNLAGQRVNKATKGVFIQNGRKYIK